MPSTLTVATILPAAAALLVIARARSAVRGTTLFLAWGWSLTAALSLLAAWLTTEVFRLLASPWDDIAWYGVALLLLCPLIAVLGARRPGVAAWNWFVILPLLAVLGWPAAAAMLAGAGPGAFVLETPPLVGVGLVLLMGTGNYAGTRFQLPIALVFAAIAVLTVSLTQWHGWRLTPAQSRAQAVWELGAAAVLARYVSRRRPAGEPGPDCVWIDFRDQFGIAWAQRIRDRVNERADQENWPVRLERSGFVSNDPSAATLEGEPLEKIEHTLRWLLRRFVDSAWIDQRLGKPAPAGVREQSEPHSRAS